jgi:hypothetical protein
VLLLLSAKDRLKYQNQQTKTLSFLSESLRAALNTVVQESLRRRKTTEAFCAFLALNSDNSLNIILSIKIIVQRPQKIKIKKIIIILGGDSLLDM